jgi:hypothetical protein
LVYLLNHKNRYLLKKPGFYWKTLFSTGTAATAEAERIFSPAFSPIPRVPNLFSNHARDCTVPSTAAPAKEDFLGLCFQLHGELSTGKINVKKDGKTL